MNEQAQRNVHDKIRKTHQGKLHDIFLNRHCVTTKVSPANSRTNYDPLVPPGTANYESSTLFDITLLHQITKYVKNYVPLLAIMPRFSSKYSEILY